MVFIKDLLILFNSVCNSILPNASQCFHQILPGWWLLDIVFTSQPSCHHITERCIHPTQLWKLQTQGPSKSSDLIMVQFIYVLGDLKVMGYSFMYRKESIGVHGT